ncbi:MAG TPA: hypothetical protein VIT68_00015 [Candidatus Gracilibacteria bacterium]
MQEPSVEKVEGPLESSGEISQGSALETPVQEIEKGVESIVSSARGTDDAPIVSTATAHSSWDIMSSRVSSLLGFKKEKAVKIPAPKVQRMKVDKALHREIRKLTKQADRMMGRSRFSADKYEEVLKQIRKFQSMLVELYSLTTETLEQWYRQYVLRLV